MMYRRDSEVYYMYSVHFEKRCKVSDVARGQKSHGPLKKSLEIAQK